MVWEYSRFSRNPAEANPYVRERQQNPGYNLHQGRELDEGPKLLTPERANAIMEAFVEAERYVIRQRRSGMRSHKAKAELGYPVGKSRSVWHAQEGTGARKRMVLKPELDGMGIDIYLSVVAGDTLEELGARYGRNADRISSFVRSPSNAGLTCLRTDEERALERDYRGELYPPFLLIDKPDELCEFTVESVRAERRLDTPVQQVVPYWLWRRAQEALEGRPSATRGVQGGFKNLGSGFFRCDCGQRFTRHGSSYGCRKGHLLPTGRKRGRQPRYDVASDGRSHAKVADHIVHMVLRELAFACHRAAEKTAEYERAKTQAQSSSAIDPNGKLRRATCEAELSSIEAERERVGALFQAGMMSATKMSDEAKQLKQREAKARIELSGLSKDARRQRRALVKPGHSVESAWAEAERTGRWRGSVASSAPTSITFLFSPGGAGLPTASRLSSSTGWRFRRSRFARC